MTTGGAGDQRTRRRLVDAGTRRFAELGFRRATIRAIAHDAGANVAAVNYHFRDKMGLYMAVLEEAAVAVREATAAAIRAGEGLSAEDKLRAYVRVHCDRVFAWAAKPPRRQTRFHELIQRELNDPTPALGTLVDRALRPRFEYLGQVIGELLSLPPDHAIVVQCSISLHGQVIAFRPNPVVHLMMPRKLRAAFGVRAVSRHIAEFSLAGIRTAAPR